jgi:hypothetical protein
VVLFSALLLCALQILESWKRRLELVEKPQADLSFLRLFQEQGKYSGGCGQVRVGKGSRANGQSSRAAVRSCGDQRVNVKFTSATHSGTAAFLTSSSSSTALYFWTSFVYIDSSTTQLAAVQFRNGFSALFCVCHLDKRESARTSCIPICHEGDAINLSVLPKKLTQFVFASSEIEIPDKNVFHKIYSIDVGY